MSSSEWSNSVVGVLSPSAFSPSALSLGSSPTVQSEVEWAMHMGIPAVVFPAVPASPNFARLLHSTALLVSGSSTSIWLDVNFEPKEACYGGVQSILSSCDNASTIGLNLRFPEQETSSVTIATVLVHLNRFFGLPVKGVTLPTSIFLTNKKGYPTLSKKMQVVIEWIMKRGGDKIRWVIEGEKKHFPADENSQNNTSGYLNYLQYLFHLRSRSDVTEVLDCEEAKAESSYLDYLQAPLQPLADNLEFGTYETFERDPVKYRNYESAVLLAIRDGVNLQKWGGNTGNNVVNLMVVGAGRGPLVRASLNAVKRYNSTCLSPNLQPLTPRMLAVEKNPSAVIFLHSLVALEPGWKEVVRVISSDMREAVVAEEEKADIVVSELLGSFGDNELSPECLDGAEKSGLMKPDAVSIPTNYISYIAPLSSTKLHQEAKAQSYSATDGTHGPMGQPFGYLRAMETPYVVRSHAATQTHIEKECFTYVHPNPDLNDPAKSNSRFVRVEFESDEKYGMGNGCGYGLYNQQDAKLAEASEKVEGEVGSGITIHGLTGSFDSLLYKSQTENFEEHISIAPQTFSVGMFSWFPLFFPLRDPVFLPPGCTAGVNIWRLGDGKKIWYEWSVDIMKEGSLVSSTPVHNPNGRSYQVGL
ncbi:hypothetical protein TrST_g5002 [Triparma strigata]|uniref:Protein arginine N-methyltransferase n=2 Tax=Triparma TaxID=722752 RepID=A0A9W7AVE4_9STRA|nr:hypothetical protein TrST_g5002 [Triparma strigata]